MSIRITVLGCRGSLPAGRKDTVLFGGDTSCYEVQAGEDLIYLDAGSGLVSAQTQGTREVHLLLSHPHLDHLMGFGLFPALRQDCRIHIYGAVWEGRNPEEQMRLLFAPPLWPVWPGDGPAQIFFHTVMPGEAFHAGGFWVDWMPSCHPGGSAVYRLRRDGKILVYATDFEHGIEAEQELIRFAEGADLLLYDGQYTPEEHDIYPGFGHSTGETGRRIGEACGAKRVWIIHHDPRATDAILTEREKRLGIHYARQGERVEL